MSEKLFHVKYQNLKTNEIIEEDLGYPYILTLLVPDVFKILEIKEAGE